MKYLKDLKNFEGKTALVNSSLDVNDTKGSLRLERGLETLRFLRDGKAKVLIIGHRGQPHGHFDKNKSHKHLIPFYKSKLSRNIHFFDHFNPKEIRQKIEKSPNGSVFLLENIRFNIGEEKNDATFGHQLAGLADFYVNDDFPTSHRAHASFVQVPKHIPAFAGLALEKEISELEGVMEKPKKPLLIILAGGKANDKYSVVEKIYDKANQILIGGVIANTMLRAMGEDIGSSIVDSKLLERLGKYKKQRKVILPKDYIKEGSKILDIGKETEKDFVKRIRQAGTVVWAGPMGLFEDPRYRSGSEAVASAISKSRAYSIIGGGETTILITDMKIKDKINFISTGGSAMLAFLAGKKMPGIKALK